MAEVEFMLYTDRDSLYWDEENPNSERYRVWRAVAQIMKENGTWPYTDHPVDIYLERLMVEESH